MSVTWKEALAKIQSAAEAVRDAAAQSDDGELETPSNVVPQQLISILGCLRGDGDANDESKQIKLMQQQHSALQTKLDKITRQLEALTESQNKTNKVSNLT